MTGRMILGGNVIDPDDLPATGLLGGNPVTFSEGDSLPISIYKQEDEPTQPVLDGSIWIRANGVAIYNDGLGSWIGLRALHIFDDGNNVYEYRLSPTAWFALLDGAPGAEISMLPTQITIGMDGGQSLVFGDQLVLSGLPTSDPAVAGALWNDAGTLKISAG